MMDADEPSPLDFETLGGHLIDTYQNHGATGLREWLNAYVAADCTRETLQQTAAELAAMKALRPAKMVARAALKCPPMTDVRFCAYTTTPTGHILEHWQQRQQYRADVIHKRIGLLLGQAGLTRAWLGDSELVENTEMTSAEG